MGKLNLEPETKCGFYVDSNRKKVWQVELDILEKVVDICKRHSIKYFLCGGTLLGAVRHQGYIPWDDDIDLLMKRDEYNKFINIAEKELKYPYFMQCYKTEKEYVRGHMQIRNSETTAIIQGDIYNKYNKGIFIDIFPLDNIPDNKWKKKIFMKEIKLKKEFLRYKHHNDENIQYTNFRGKLKKQIFKFVGTFCNFQKVINKFEKRCQKYNKIKTVQCGAIAFRPEEFKYDNSWFDESVEVKFEYFELPIPKGYNELLTRQYGDYMEIPENKNGSLHGNVFFDTEKSYKTYEKNIDEIVEKLK